MGASLPGSPCRSTVPGEWGGEEQESKKVKEKKFSPTTHSKADWSSFTNHPFYTPNTPPKLESTGKRSEHMTVKTVDLPRNIFFITFLILEDVLLKKLQFKIVLKTYLKIGL